MVREELRHPSTSNNRPDGFVDGKQSQRFTNTEKNRGNHITGPMSAQIDPGIADSCRNGAIQPAASAVKQRAERRNDAVVRHVTGRKRWSGLVAIRGI